MRCFFSLAFDLGQIIGKVSRELHQILKTIKKLRKIKIDSFS